MSKARTIVSFPSGRRGKWVVVVLWIVILAVCGSLAGKLTGAEKNDAQSWLPAQAQSTKVLALQSRFQSPNVFSAVVVYDRPSGLTAADRAKGVSDAQRFMTISGVERGQVAIHLRRGAITLFGIVRASFDQHVVELQQLFAVGTLTQLRIDLRKIESIFSGAHFVKKFAEAEDVGLRRPRPFRRHVTFRADKRLLTARRDQADVGEFRHAIDENDVRRFDVAMSQAVTMQRFESLGQGNAELDRFAGR